MTRLSEFQNMLTGLSDLHKDAIQAMLTSAECTIPCRLIYSITKWDDCINCLLAPGGRRSSNIYQTGGPIPFTRGKICPWCFSGDVMVQTVDGYNKIKDINIGDCVYDGKEYNKVSQKYSRQYSGKLLNIKTFGVALHDWVTPNHKFNVIRCPKKYKKLSRWMRSPNFSEQIQIQQVPAEDLTLNDYVVLPKCSHDKCGLKNIFIPGIGDIDVDDDLLYFFGWWIAEGYVHRRSSKINGKDISSEGNFALNKLKEQNVADKLVDICQRKFGIKALKKQVKHANTVLVQFYATRLVRYMLCFGHKSYNKYIPSFLWRNLSLEQKMVLLKYYCCGDGHVRSQGNRTNEHNIATVSKTLAFQVYNILLSFNYYPSISCTKARYANGCNHRDSYIVYWKPSGQGKGRTYIEGIGYISKIKSIREKVDTIIVYNLEVENSHKYTANGILVNNCHGKGKVKIAPETETIELVVLWDARDWIDIHNLRLSTAEDKVQTISMLSSTLAKIKRATSIVFGTDIENFERHMYARDGEPVPCGFGANNFIATMWKKHD